MVEDRHTPGGRIRMKYDIEFLENYWMPFTANRDFKADPRIIVRGEGVYMYTPEDEAILDGSSGLFCCAAGHSRPEIAEAVYAQLQQAAYVPPFQLSQPLSFELARRVAQLTPNGLDHIFFREFWLGGGGYCNEDGLRLPLRSWRRPAATLCVARASLSWR